MTRKRVAILISGPRLQHGGADRGREGAGLSGRDRAGRLQRPDAAGLARAREAGIATAVLDHKPFGKDRAAFERALQAMLDEQRIELICLAGFMRLFTARFVQHWTGGCSTSIPRCCRRFQGLDPHGRALARGREDIGRDRSLRRPGDRCRADHRAGSVPVLAGDTPDTLAARVLEVEHRIYPLALKRVAEGSA